MLNGGDEHRGGGHEGGVGSCPARRLLTCLYLNLTNHPIMGTVIPLPSATGLKISLRVLIVTQTAVISEEGGAVPGTGTSASIRSISVHALFHETGYMNIVQNNVSYITGIQKKS